MAVAACWARASASDAELTFAWAALTSSSTAVLSMRASTCPALTVSPAVTSSSVTTPAVLKLRPRVCCGCTVPAADSVTLTVPRWTATVDSRTVDAAGRTIAYPPTPSNARAGTPIASQNTGVRRTGHLMARQSADRTSEKPRNTPQICRMRFPANSKVRVT